MSYSKDVEYKKSQYVRVKVSIYPTDSPKPEVTEALGYYPRDGEVAGSVFTFETEAATGSAAATHDDTPMLVGLNYSHTINTPASACRLQIKSRGIKAEALLELLQPNHWIDVSILQHKKSNHIFRGRIIGSQISIQAGDIGGKAAATLFSISCRGFGHILSQTQVYYDIVSEGLKLAGAYSRILINPDNHRSVTDTLKSLLTGFLDSDPERGTGRTQWELPIGLPGQYKGITNQTRTDRPFIDLLKFLPDDDPRAFENYPQREASQALSWLSGATGGENLWTILQRWNDNPLVDLYTDLVDADTGTYLYEGQETTPETTAMSVILRDKPFPTGTRSARAVGVTDLRMSERLWFNEKDAKQPKGYLPTYHTKFTDLSSYDIARSDMNRKNAYFVSPTLTQGITGTLLDQMSPLWDLEDIRIHGLRSLYYTTPYLIDLYTAMKEDKDYIELIEIYRERLRDFGCLGADYFSGTVEFAYGRPDIRVGGKLKIQGGALYQATLLTTDTVPTEEKVEIYYIDQVTHSWSPVRGMRTGLTLTRGVRGPDSTRIKMLSSKIQGYTVGVEKKTLANDTSTTEESTFVTEQYPPNSDKAIQLFTEAAALVSVPASWASDPGLHNILRKESNGWVGRPNYTYGPRAREDSLWGGVLDELKLGKITATSSATGLGQLLLRNVDLYYPTKRAGLGVAAQEAAGMLAYIEDRYGDPANAWASYGNMGFEGY
jgi:hypothetical protein